MTVALRSPTVVRALIPVDNAPVDAVLESNFSKYIQGMREIEEKHVTRQPQADEVLKSYEDVSHDRIVNRFAQSVDGPNSQFPSGNFSSPTWSVAQTGHLSRFESRSRHWPQVLITWEASHSTTRTRTDTRGPHSLYVGQKAIMFQTTFYL